MGEKLYRELDNSPIDIVVGIDKREGLIYASIPLHNSVQVLENTKVEPVIITADSAYDHI